MKKQKQKKQSEIGKKLGLVLLACVVAVGTFFLVKHLAEREDTNVDEDGDTVIITDEDLGLDIPPEPPVDEETGFRIVDVVLDVFIDDLNGSSNIWAGGDLKNTIDDSGVCTYTFIGPRGQVKIFEREAARAGPRNSMCLPVDEPKSDFNRGAWSVRLEYKSETHMGVSEEETFDVD
jgi:hypothetical protein